MRPSSFFWALTAAACVAASARPAGAAGRPILVVHRTEDAAGCPDARALAALVAEQMKRPALEPAGDLPAGAGRGLDVQIYRSAQGFTAVLQAGGKTRQISDQGTTCGGLAGALAVSIAVLLDTEPLPPPPEPPPVEPATPVVEARVPVSTPPVPLPSDSSVPGAPAPDRVASPRLIRISLAAAPVLTVGVLQGFAGGITSEVELRVGRFTVAAGVLVLPGQSVSYGAGQVSLELTAGMLRACGIVAGDDPMRFVLCVDPVAGSMRGSGQGFTVNRVTTLPWAAVGTSALFQQRIWGPLSWGARAGILIPLVKDSMQVDNLGTAFTAAPVGGAWDAELRVSIW